MNPSENKEENVVKTQENEAADTNRPIIEQEGAEDAGKNLAIIR